MALKKIRFTAFLIITLTISSIISMQESISEKEKSSEEYTYLFEKLPNELILPIFCYKIQSIIDTTEPAQATKKFEAILNSPCFVKKRFDSFKEELKKYFETHKKPEITDVVFSRTELRFKVDNKEFVMNEEDAAIDTFLDEVTSINDDILNKIGKATVEEVEKTVTEQNDRETTFAKLFSTIIYASYVKAEDGGNGVATAKIKELVKPLLKAYPNHRDSLLKNNFKKYSLTIQDIILFQINNNTKS